MRTSTLSWATSALLLASACNSDSSGSDNSANPDANLAQEAGVDGGTAHGEHPSSGDSGAGAGFDPPPAKEGYMRIVAPVAKDLAPGSNTTLCQYIQAPFDRDLDVMDVGGYQSTGGHHAVAYSIKTTVPVGTSRPCTPEDNLVGGFVGGIGGEASGGVQLPDGVAFRLPKGSAIQLNAHYINTTDKPIDGHAVLDFKLAEVTGTRKIASLFSNGDLAFTLAPHGTTELVAECVVPRELQFILFTNHMHEWGASAKTELIHPDGGVELAHEDPVWRPEMAFKAVYNKWPVEAPFVVAQGDTLRTRCTWNNTTENAIGFPSEMCFGVGFFLSDGSSSPVCLHGVWTNE